ncbi:MAG: butyrate kinase [Rectinemataceae bacterium]
MLQRVLVVNPGSTSTKIAVFEGATRLFDQGLTHSAEELSAYPTIASQYEFRDHAIRAVLAARGFDMSTLGAVVGRGGLLKPIPGGVYRVNDDMKADIEEARYGEHASNLGALIAGGLAVELGIPAFIADPVVVDELSDLARVSGHKLFRRISIFHALNQKAVARRYCAERGLRYEEATLIVAHMGGGVSVGLHRRGRVEDVNQALSGEGPFSPERSGTLPAGDLARLCFSGKYSQKEVLRMISGSGGMVSFIGSNDMRDAENGFHAGDPDATLYFKAFIYQVGKAVGALAAAACGKVDGIILTGGIAYGRDVVEGLTEMCSFIAPVVAYPGEGELEALAKAGYGALSGELPILEYRR